MMFLLKYPVFFFLVSYVSLFLYPNPLALIDANRRTELKTCQHTTLTLHVQRSLRKLSKLFEPLSADAPCPFYPLTPVFSPFSFFPTLSRLSIAIIHTYHTALSLIIVIHFLSSILDNTFSHP